jgi:hypothetical protein
MKKIVGVVSFLVTLSMLVSPTMAQDIIHTSDSADGTTALRLLRQDYDLESLEGVGLSFSFEHAVIGAMTSTIPPRYPC